MTTGFDSIRPKRIAGLDYARGIALALMVVSHGIKGLLYFREMPEWGIVPVHLLTKFSSTLFILVFGVTLAVVYVPRAVSAPARTRNHLWWRALVIFAWYKALTFVQLTGRLPAGEVKKALLFEYFPDFVEVLAFYAYTLLWIAPMLRYWRRIPMWLQPALAMLPWGVGWWLYRFESFGGLWQLKAILVESPKHFCFGVITRASIVLFGLFLGEAIRRRHISPRGLGVVLAAAGALLLGYFLGSQGEWLSWELERLARNFGKHPPTTAFLLFSGGGSIALLGMSLWLTRYRWWLRPLEMFGRHALLVFCWHILIIFTVYRDALNLRGAVTYPQALGLTAVVLLSSWGVAELRALLKAVWSHFSAVGPTTRAIRGRLIYSPGD